MIFLFKMGIEIDYNYEEERLSAFDKANTVVSKSINMANVVSKSIKLITEPSPKEEQFSDDEYFDLCQEILKRHNISFNRKDIISGGQSADECFVRSLIVFILQKQGVSIRKIGALIKRNETATIRCLRFGDTDKFHRKESGQIRKDYVLKWHNITAKLNIELSIEAGDIESLKKMIKYHENKIKEIRERLDVLELNKIIQE